VSTENYGINLTDIEHIVCLASLSKVGHVYGVCEHDSGLKPTTNAKSEKTLQPTYVRKHVPRLRIRVLF
jgi:hypothetical protein